MNELTTTQKKELLPSAQNFLQHAKQYIKEIGDTFFLVGCHLYEAQIYHYVEALGYNSIEELAEAELDLGKSSTYNLINVFKRFCDRDEYGNHKIWIKPAFKKYKYSQLVEMQKAYCLSNNIEKEIPPSTSVRVLKEYIKYLNKNPGDHKSLPDWQLEQEQTSMLPPISDSNPINEETTYTVPEEPQPDTNVNNVVPTAEQPTETVQTFGLPTCAEPEKTGTVIEPEDETPIYNLKARDSVRVFLKDYRNWTKGYGFHGAFIEDIYFTVLKNRVTVWALVTKIVVNPTTLESTETVTYFIDDDKRRAKMITKEQFERYCAEHKDEL